MEMRNYKGFNSKFMSIRAEDARVDESPKLLSFIMCLLKLALGLDSSVSLRFLAFGLYTAFDGGSHLVVIRLSWGLRHDCGQGWFDTPMHAAGEGGEWIADEPTRRAWTDDSQVESHERPRATFGHQAPIVNRDGPTRTLPALTLKRNFSYNQLSCLARATTHYKQS